MYKVGLSTPGFLNEDLFKQYNQAGIECMEVSINDELSRQINFDDLSKWSKKYNVKLWSFHLPFAPFEKIDISKKELCENNVRYLSEYVKKGSSIGIDKFVIHASGEPIEESARKERMNCSKDSLNSLAEIAYKCGSTIAVENLPRTCLGRNSDDILDLISANDKLRVCFDTNHLLSEKSDDFLRKIGSKIITMHVSDYDFQNERHWLPGEGDINWPKLLEILKEICYNGVWMYEIGFKCPNTIIRDRDLNCNDFVQNAKELFSGNDITIISKRKENLGYWE